MRNLFLIPTATIVLGQVDLRIPLDVDRHKGLLNVNVTMLPSGSRPMPFAISILRTNIAIFDETYVDGGTDIRIDGNPSFEFTDGDIEISSSEEEPHEISLLGIGPLGSLVQTVGAVAVIRQNNSASAELVLGSSLSVFNPTCAFSTVQIKSFQNTYHFFF